MDPIADGGSSEWMLKEPEVQTKARAEERDNVFQAYPILEDLLKRLQDRIDFYKSVDSVAPEVLTEPDKFMHVIAANKLAAQNLQTEYDTLDSLIKEHLQPNIG